jgi:acetyltransferase-like isoleucine patch superfamily enzyme
MPNLTVTRGLLDLLRSRRVFLSYQGQDRWRVGDVVGVNDHCELEPYAQIFAGHMLPRTFGAFSYSHSQMSRTARVGRYCSIARDVAWMGPAHPTTWASTSPIFFDLGLPATRAFRATHGGDYPVADFPQPESTVAIGHDVWIGEQTMIAPGVTIGDGAIIGARTLVLADVPPYAVVVGHPGRIVRYRISEALIERFLAVQWWRYTPDALNTLPATEPERFLDALEDLVDRAPPRQIAPILLTAADLAAAARPDAPPAI